MFNTRATRLATLYENFWILQGSKTFLQTFFLNLSAKKHCVLGGNHSNQNKLNEN